MSIDAASRRRYGRQVLLGEIGEGGQARLLDARVSAHERADRAAHRVAEDYLVRAGMAQDDAGSPVRVPDASVVRRVAGSESLLGPAAAIVGAYCAVEHLKAVLGLGEPKPFPKGISLKHED